MKVNLGLSLLFSLIVLIIVFITAALTSVISYILYQTGAVNLLSRRNPLWIMAILFLVSIVISTIISVVSSKYTLRPIQLCVLQDFPTQYCKEKVHTFAPEIFL